MTPFSPQGVRHYGTAGNLTWRQLARKLALWLRGYKRSLPRLPNGHLNARQILIRHRSDPSRSARYRSAANASPGTLVLGLDTGVLWGSVSVQVLGRACRKGRGPVCRAVKIRISIIGVPNLPPLRSWLPNRHLFLDYKPPPVELQAGRVGTKNRKVRIVDTGRAQAHLGLWTTSARGALEQRPAVVALQAGVPSPLDGRDRLGTAWGTSTR